jgi:hypothetical protein
MAHLLIRHQVQDVGQWQPMYDAHQADRAAAGLQELKLWHNSDDSNEIVLLFEISDVEQAKAFVESKDLNERMTAAGVTATSDSLFLASNWEGLVLHKQAAPADHALQAHSNQERMQTPMEEKVQ